MFARIANPRYRGLQIRAIGFITLVLPHAGASVTLVP